MWICTKCNEENEDNFDVCWNCGVQTNGKPSKDINEFEKSKSEIEIQTNEPYRDRYTSRGPYSSEYTSSFDTTRIIAQIVSFTGWLVVVASSLIFIIMIVKASQSRYGFEWLGLLPAFSGIVSGLFLVMSGQLTRAIVDNTDNTGKMLSILEEIAEKE